MKTRILVSLPLALVLALPAFAQTSSTSQSATSADQTAPASQTVGASGKEPLQPMTHEGFWGRVNPFARKKYVQRQTQPIQDRVNELDELTASNTKMTVSYTHLDVYKRQVPERGLCDGFPARQ